MPIKDTFEGGSFESQNKGFGEVFLKTMKNLKSGMKDIFAGDPLSEKNIDKNRTKLDNRRKEVFGEPLQLENLSMTDVKKKINSIDPLSLFPEGIPLEYLVDESKGVAGSTKRHNLTITRTGREIYPEFDDNDSRREERFYTVTSDGSGRSISKSHTIKGATIRVEKGLDDTMNLIIIPPSNVPDEVPVVSVFEDIKSFTSL